MTHSAQRRAREPHRGITNRPGVRRSLIGMALAGVLAGACSAPHETDQRYRVEGATSSDGRKVELVVKVRNMATDNYVADAKVWHVSVEPGGFSPRGPRFSEARHVMTPDGKDGYAISFAQERHRDIWRYEHFIVSVPGEDELVHARIAVSPAK